MRGSRQATIGFGVDQFLTLNQNAHAICCFVERNGRWASPDVLAVVIWFFEKSI